MTLLEKLKYMFHNRVLPKPPVTFFPNGGPYVCGSGKCDRTFTTYYTRNFHQWKEHPGCPRYRKPTFGAWMNEMTGDHSSRCQSASECTHGCWLLRSPFRNGG